MTTERTEALSDGVIGFAATLLVLNVTAFSGFLSHTTDLASQLLLLWPSYATYCVSFMTIGIIWMNHHALFRRIRIVDRPLQVLNLLLLMVIAFIPFPTGLLSASLQSGTSQGVAGAFYGLTFAAMGITFSSVWAYAVHKRLIHESIHRGHAKTSIVRTAAGAPGYPVGALVSVFSARLGLLVYALLALFYLFDWLPPPGLASRDG